MLQIPFTASTISPIGDREVMFENLMPEDFGINYKDAKHDTSVSVCAIIYYENGMNNCINQEVQVRTAEDYKIDGEIVYDAFVRHLAFGKPTYIEFMITPLKCRTFKWRITVI